MNGKEKEIWPEFMSKERVKDENLYFMAPVKHDHQSEDIPMIQTMELGYRHRLSDIFW